MAYDPNVPSPFDRIVVSQGDILANYKDISDSTTVNHSALNSADQGKHKFVQLPVIGAPNIPAAVNNMPLIYNSVSAVGVNDDTTIVIKEKQPILEDDTVPFDYNIKYVQTQNFPLNYFQSYSGYQLPSGLIVKNYNIRNISSSTSTIAIKLVNDLPLFGTYLFHLVSLGTSSIGSPVDPGYYAYLINYMSGEDYAFFRIVRRSSVNLDPNVPVTLNVTFFGV